MEGWIKLHRKILEDDLWINCTPEQKIMMIVIMLSANHEAKTWIWRGYKYNVGPGQFITSIEALRKKCGKGFSTKMIRNALNKFEKYEFVAIERSREGANDGTKLTVCKWDSYQDTGQSKGQGNGQSKGQSRGNRGATNKNDNNENNQINKEMITAIVSFLNNCTGKSFKHTTGKTIASINARISEGFNYTDFKDVISHKSKAWKADPKMSEYLRPETLFGPKFEGYLQDARNPGNQTNQKNVMPDISNYTGRNADRFL